MKQESKSGHGNLGKKVIMIFLIGVLAVALILGLLYLYSRDKIMDDNSLALKEDKNAPAQESMLEGKKK